MDIQEDYNELQANYDKLCVKYQDCLEQSIIRINHETEAKLRFERAIRQAIRQAHYAPDTERWVGHAEEALTTFVEEAGFRGVSDLYKTAIKSIVGTEGK